MQISSSTASQRITPPSSENRAKFKQAFEALGKALDSGDLDAAKEAYAQIQQLAPKRTGDTNNPMQQKMDALGKALESGDLTAAKDAFADIKAAMARRPQGGQGAGGGRPAGGSPPGGGGSDSSSTSSTSNDPRDTNNDGKVSIQEAITYALKHLTTSADTTSTATTTDVTAQSGIDSRA